MKDLTRTHLFPFVVGSIFFCCDLFQKIISSDNPRVSRNLKITVDLIENFFANPQRSADLSLTYTVLDEASKKYYGILDNNINLNIPDLSVNLTVNIVSQ